MDRDVIVKKMSGDTKFNDTRLYITQHSKLEEILPMITHSTLKGMFGNTEDKQEAMRDSLKVLNFNKEDIVLPVNLDDDDKMSNDLKELKEQTMTLCAEFREYLKHTCIESCNFILENHNLLKELINNSEAGLESLKKVRTKYMYRNAQVVEEQYNTRVLSLSQTFENDVKFIKGKKFNPSVERSNITNKSRMVQTNLLKLYKSEPSAHLLQVIHSYEQDIYNVEKETCQLFGDYLQKWSASLLT